MHYSILTDVDSYKASHFKQYPQGTTYISSYIEPRKNNFNFEIEGVVHFGLQMFINDIMDNKITLADVYKAKRLFESHGEPFNFEGWEYIQTMYDGHLPLEIQGVDEGTVVPIGTPVVQVVNTDPKVPWLTSYVETAILRSVWYPSTVATLSREIKRVIYQYLLDTSDDPDSQINFKLHDFGSRGVSSYQSAMRGGLAHLINFMGTDTIPAILAASDHYYMHEMPAFSIPAAEHSTITSWGEAREIDAYENMIDQFAGEGKIYAVVSDSYDLYNAVSNIWGDALRDKVLSSGGTLVIRPDSGHPPDVVLKVLLLLKDKFDISVNSKGYQLLPPQIRLIQGDGIDYHMINGILFRMKQEGWAADNIAFGMGGALLQQVNRDTLGYAMKCNAIKFENGKWVPVSKKPKTDLGKSSKAGYINNIPVRYQNGILKNSMKFNEIRELAKI